jgi:hypothetical protein
MLVVIIFSSRVARNNPKSQEERDEGSASREADSIRFGFRFTNQLLYIEIVLVKFFSMPINAAQRVGAEMPISGMGVATFDVNASLDHRSLS